MQPLRLTLITRRECHLCDEMAAAIEQVQGAVPTVLEVCDVDADAELLARYTDEVPVLLINGRKAFKYRLTAADLARRLRAERRRAVLGAWRERLLGRRPS